MFHEKLKTICKNAIDDVASTISQFTTLPGKYLTRSRKLPADQLISFLISQGASSSKIELLDYFQLNSSAPSLSALNQQRAKLCPEALETVFKKINTAVAESDNPSPYRFLAADGSTFSFFSRPSFASAEYYVSEGHSAKGFFSMHLNALYDLSTHTYVDALIQPVHEKDEFHAFCEMVDRCDCFLETQNVFIGDRGYCSYNNMAPNMIIKSISRLLHMYAESFSV